MPDPLADTQARRRRFLRRLLRFADQQRNLALDVAARLQCLQHFAGASPQKFFVQLGDLAGDYHVPLRSKDVDNIFQGLNDTVRCFVENLGAGRGFDSLQFLATLTALGRKEAAETE